MARKEKHIEITSVGLFGWTIPMFGNKHSIPYGTLSIKGIVDGVEVHQNCKTHGDLYTDHSPHQYVVFQGVRFIVRNEGSLYYPKLTLTEWKKEKINNRWAYYTQHV